ncbi:MAG TPA: cytidylate kinase-like family protein [Candidatus Baltobacteraceae bacterium]|nr:cytidylate kinase-like family protein [Candidatus Baltobacteraceae bacterium]
MTATSGYESCLSFISGQARAGGLLEPEKARGICRAITISRQAGCGALVVAEKVANLLQSHVANDAPSWTVFDQNLMAKVLEDHNMPKYLARFLPEDRVSQFEDFLAELSAMYPPSYTVVEHMSETIFELVNRGNVILIGRGANLITSRLPHILHVRLVAPFERRVAFSCEAYHKTAVEAREFCRREDLGRLRYLKKHFNADIEDPLLYHMVINTAMTGYDGAAKLIADAAMDEA